MGKRKPVHKQNQPRARRVTRRAGPPAAATSPQVSLEGIEDAPTTLAEVIPIRASLPNPALAWLKGVRLTSWLWFSGACVAVFACITTLGFRSPTVQAVVSPSTSRAKSAINLLQSRYGELMRARGNIGRKAGAALPEQWDSSWAKISSEDTGFADLERIYRADIQAKADKMTPGYHVERITEFGDSDQTVDFATRGGLPGVALHFPDGSICLVNYPDILEVVQAEESRRIFIVSGLIAVCLAGTAIFIGYLKDVHFKK